MSPKQVNRLIQECNSKHGLFLVSVADAKDETGNGFNGAALEGDKAVRKSATDRAVGATFAAGTALSIELAVVMLMLLTGAITVNLELLPFLIKVLVVVVALIQPFLVISLCLNGQLIPKPVISSPLSILSTVLTLALWLFWCWFLDSFGAIAAPLGDQTDKSFIEEKTNDIILAGVTVTAILSGVGCALTPVRSFWLERSKKDRSNDNQSELRSLDDLVQSYNATRLLEEKRRRELLALELKNIGSVCNNPSFSSLRLMKNSGKHLFNKVHSFTNLSAFGLMESEELELKREIASLETLHQQVYSELTQKLLSIIESNEYLQKRGLDWKKFTRVFDYAFALYCLYKLANVLVCRLAYQFMWGNGVSNSGLDRNGSEGAVHSKDALALTLAKIVQSFNYFPLSETQLVHQISFLLSGSLFACSFQNVLVTFKTIGRFLPSHPTLANDNIRGWLKNLIVSQLLAIFVIAAALLIRLNLPPDAAEQMLEVLSLSKRSCTLEGMKAEVDFVDAWFDKIFAITSVVTLLVIALKLYAERDGAEDYDEEMMIEDQSRAKFA